MICLGCKELHAGKDLAVVDAGISLGLGDCRQSGSRHHWAKVKLVLDVPYTRTPGTYTLKKISSKEAQEFVSTGIIVSALLSQVTSQLMSRVLDMPLIHRKEKFFQFDMGDEALSLVVSQPWSERKPVTALAEGRDYEFALLKRTE